MSENRDRRTDRFSKYDSMPTEALEEILRLDAEAPEEQESDTELFLYVMGVLANRRNTDITGNTAEQAWESFQKSYLDEECLEDKQETKKNRIATPWLRRLIAAAAVIVLVVSLPLSANAFGLEDIWNIVARWAKETFSFVSENEERREPSSERKDEESSLQKVLADSQRKSDMVPTLIPERFVLDKIEKDITPAWETYRANYIDGDDELRIKVQIHTAIHQQSVEIEEDILEVYISNGTEFFIFENMEQIQVLWIKDSYECTISGDISIDDAKEMIDSIGKG